MVCMCDWNTLCIYSIVYSVYIQYSIQCVYIVYSVYIQYSIQCVYIVYSVYIQYSIVYSVYI